MIFNKGTKAIQWRKQALSINGGGVTGHLYGKKKLTLLPYLSLYKCTMWAFSHTNTSGNITDSSVNKTDNSSLNITNVI